MSTIGRSGKLGVRIAGVRCGDSVGESQSAVEIERDSLVEVAVAVEIERVERHGRVVAGVDTGRADREAVVVVLPGVRVVIGAVGVDK
jgi:hypothetical protein